MRARWQEFRIEIADDNALQDHPLLIKCWDKDLMSSDDEIGAVCIDLNPLLLEARPPRIETAAA